MKKILLMAVAALMFVACNENAPGGAKDQKATKMVSAEAIDLIGADLAEVDKKLTAAGYIKYEEKAEVKMPARVKALRAKETEEAELMYFYGYPANYAEMSEKEVDDYMEKAIKEGKTLGMAYVVGDNGKMALLQSIFYIGITDKINNFYIDLSNGLYAKLPKEAIQEEMKNLPFAYWSGIFTQEHEQQDTEITDRAEFLARLAAAKEIQVSEGAGLITSAQYDGWMYSTYWLNPNEETKQEMTRDLGGPIVYGQFMVANIKQMIK